VRLSRLRQQISMLDDQGVRFDRVLYVKWFYAGVPGILKTNVPLVSWTVIMI
jgi:hypothetical protein